MKPSEVKLVVSLLVDEDWDTPEDAAKAIITALDAKRKADDKPWIVVRPAAGLFYGPYPTQNAARKAASKAVAITHNEQAKLARLFATLEEPSE